MAAFDHRLLKLTQDIISCRKGLEPDMFVDAQSVLSRAWAPPRGWAGTGSAPIDIVLVALNPGGPLPGEISYYSAHGITKENRAATPEQATALNDYCLRQYRTPQRGTNWRFHRNSVALARCLLWLIDDRDPGRAPWDRCWFTDIFNCSTRAESNPGINDAAFRACRPHFDRELQLLKPKLIIALGDRAEERLQSSGVDHVKFRHPSNGFRRLDAISYDASFDAAARHLGVAVPAGFRDVRAQVYRDARHSPKRWADERVYQGEP